ncbi:MAG TPA: HAMP domain-containing sensor histidine kinase [Candidatus Dormibacteraeota bacterium]|nr:HAMP domain-containing sensor histidine kinase [Candidatus Dormibacteraeota bacterium]
MTAALPIAQAAVSLSFFALGLFTVVDWLRHRERSRGYLALALGTLGLTSILGQLNTLTGYRTGPGIGDVTIVLFIISGYALLLFRGSFIPLPRALQLSAVVALVATGVFAMAVGAPSSPDIRPTAIQSVATLVLILAWSACVIEPVVRFWLAARRRPGVQRARLRALAGGYAAIVLLLLVAGFGGSAVSNPLAMWLFEIVAIIALPLLLAGFAPPLWLRRIWRQAEEGQFRDALHDLVLFSPDRPTLAKRAAEWAARLVGADGSAIVDADGQILAIHGMSVDTVRQLAAEAGQRRGAQLVATPGSSLKDAVVVPLPLDAGTGAMVVVSGPFTPFFGADEVSRLRAYSANITTALDRARVTERLAALEKVKSQFLNLASHELRSPLGVIAGYLSMLEQGALGVLTEAGIHAVEVLKAKALEMNLLVAQMLDAARLEEGRLTLKRAQHDLRDIVREGLKVVGPMATPHHELSLDTPESVVPVFGDEDRLLTIVTNLLENAIKYSPQGGLVRCVVSAVDGSALVTVIDTGVGISAEDLPRLFGRFERIQNPRTSHVAGTGLGLYLSRELARQHSGDIEVQSRAGVGSTFTLILPLMKPLTKGQPAQPAPVMEPVPAAPRLHVVAAEGDSESQSA